MAFFLWVSWYLELALLQSEEIFILRVYFSVKLYIFSFTLFIYLLSLFILTHLRSVYSRDCITEQIWLALPYFGSKIIEIDLAVAEIYTAHGFFEERDPNIEGITEPAWE